MFPRELWNIIYHLSNLKTLISLSIVNKQFDNELSNNQFWTLYTQDKLICPFNHDTRLQWINEIKYINKINQFIRKLNHTPSLCQVILKYGNHWGNKCNRLECQHQDIEGVINKGRVVYHIAHMDVNMPFFQQLDYNMIKYIKSYRLIIYKYQYVSIENQNGQIFYEKIPFKDLQLLIYQIHKQLNL